MKIQSSVVGIGQTAEVRADARIRQALAERETERTQQPRRAPQAREPSPTSSAQGGK
ncbi:hypothetical protein [Hyphomicrobium sp. MC1]|uniref:hypothetical protein n=1 Tax=Hyphomicrobium sp. (strain MC1) TaxID=717785 RepID=UPI00030321E3|nr:hypothetical protein [Hyphomicrobium sp. MC1]